jgi:hypothetical protein
VHFFVKSELPENKVDEFTRKYAKGVEGGFSYVSPDGRFGYDIVECRDENDCRQRYSQMTQLGLKIHEVSPVEPLGQFVDAWTKQRPA